MKRRAPRPCAIAAVVLELCLAALTIALGHDRGVKSLGGAVCVAGALALAVAMARHDDRLVFVAVIADGVIFTVLATSHPLDELVALGFVLGVFAIAECAYGETQRRGQPGALVVLGDRARLGYVATVVFSTLIVGGIGLEFDVSHATSIGPEVGGVIGVLLVPGLLIALSASRHGQSPRRPGGSKKSVALKGARDQSDR